jgi:GMP synthase-like glutamine amidotransferase
MKALVIEHDPLSTPGRVGAHLEFKGVVLEPFVVVNDINDPEVTAVFPEEGYDALVFMGSPWSVYDPRIAGWVGPELDLIRGHMDRGTPMLNICFGAQALSAAMGGRVTMSILPEYGWGKVESVSDIILPGPWFQFHHDEFTLPVGGVELASNESGLQAFTLGRALAVQFHPEMTTDLLTSWCQAGGDIELVNNGVDPEQLITETKAKVGESQSGLEHMVDWWLEELVG